MLDPELLAVATPEERQAYEAYLRVELAKTSPLEYACYVSPRTERYPHVEYLDEHIVALVEHRLYADGPGPPSIKVSEDLYIHPETGEPAKRKLAITEPPRHGKSYHVSDHTPAWYVTRDPRGRVILASYEAMFASEWGAKAYSHVQAHPELGTHLNPKWTAASRWETTEGGGMKTAGVGGPITGKGADLFIIDDPIKNHEEAQSEILRQKAYDWYLTTSQTRLEPGGVMILMMTRWHSDDLMGRLLANEPDEWYVLRLPALAEEGDPLGRKVGEALCPSRYDERALERIRISQGALWFAAMYQGSPYIAGGNLFKAENMGSWTDTPENYRLTVAGKDPVWVEKAKCVRFQTMDLAASQKTSADFTVVSTWDVTPDRQLLLIDRYRGRIDETDHGPLVVRLWEALRPKWLLVEDKTFGTSLIKMIQRGFFGTRIIVRPYKSEADKVTKAQPAIALTEAKRVFFPADAPWLAEWQQELLEFNNGAHDDQVDTLSMAAWEVTTGALSLVPRMQAKQEADQPPDGPAARFDRMLAKRKKAARLHMLGRW